MWRHVLIWLLSLTGGIAVSYLVAELRMPSAPAAFKIGLGVAMGIIIGVVLEILGRDQRQAFGAVYLWDRHRAHDLITARTRRRLREVDPYGLAAMEILLGNVDRGRARVAKEPAKFGPAARLRRLVEAQADLAFGDTAGARDVLDRLLGGGAFRMREIERFRVALIARAALDVTDPERRRRAQEMLRAHRDDEARAFAQWLRVKDDVPIDANDRVEHAQRGAELAAVHGFEELAIKLEDRAATIGRSDDTTPYRR